MCNSKLFIVMDNKKQANLSREYRGLVSEYIRVLTFQGKVSLLHLSYVLGITPSQMSRVHTGVSSLSPEKFLILVGFVENFLDHPDRKDDNTYFAFRCRLASVYYNACRHALNISCDE